MATHRTKRGISAATVAIRVLLITVLCVSGFRTSVASENAEVAKADGAKARTPLTPEMELKYAEFLEKAREAKRRLWMKQTNARIEQMAKAAGIEAKSLISLEKPAGKAIELSLVKWTELLDTGWRQWVVEADNSSVEMMDQVMTQIDESVASDWFGDFVRPFEQPVWEEAVAAALTTEQLTGWKKVDQERTDALLKEIAGPLKATVDRTLEQQRKAFATRGAVIVATLKLPKERAAEFDTLAEKVVESVADTWRTRVQRNLLWMEDAQRLQIIRNGEFVTRPEESEIKAREIAWEEGVARILKAEEAKQLSASKDVSKERRIVAIAQILVTLLDEKVAFTTSQRERLLPLAEAAVRAAPSVLPDGAEEIYYRYNAQRILGCGRSVKQEDLDGILDETQRKRWKAACVETNPERRAVVAMGRVILPALSVAAAKKELQNGEPEDVENAMSDYFQEKAEAERKRLLDLHILKAEDAARVAASTPEAASKLTTAARGVAEAELTEWKTTIEQSTRSQLGNITPETVKQRLAGIQRSSFGRRSSGGTGLRTVWDAAVKSSLTDGQRTAWEKEVDARLSARNKSIAAMVMAEFDRRVLLTGEQWIKLEPLLVKAVNDYGPDIASIFSYSYGYPWFLQNYTMFVPVAAVSENERKAILSKEQEDKWTGSQEFGNTANYWDNIQRTHTTRMKNRKE